MNKHNLFASLVLSASIATSLLAPPVRAADHADSPTVAGDQGADLADCYFFVDPSDPTKVVLINTLRGFIVPGEAGNFAIFDPTVRYRFQIENTGDAKSDAFIDVRFSEKTSAAPQVATVKLSGKAFAGINQKKAYNGTAKAAGLGEFPPGETQETAGTVYFPTTAQKLKTGDAEIGVEFFAGETDDPFFFDIPGFVRFRDIILDGDPSNDGTAAANLNRGRDTFAGYNVLTIAFRLPIELLQNTKPNAEETTKFGLSVAAQRGTERVIKGRKIATGSFKTVDREGLPAVNALLVPLALKNAYNGATTLDDAKGKFATAIVGTLTALGTTGEVDDPETNLGFLAQAAVLNGDILRLDTAGTPGFPNGRRPADDVVDTLLTVIAGASIGDNVDENESTFVNHFPYLALPHQPRNPGVDDQTAN